MHCPYRAHVHPVLWYVGTTVGIVAATAGRQPPRLGLIVPSSRAAGAGQLSLNVERTLPSTPLVTRAAIQGRLPLPVWSTGISTKTMVWEYPKTLCWFFDPQGSQRNHCCAGHWNAACRSHGIMQELLGIPDILAAAMRPTTVSACGFTN